MSDSSVDIELASTDILHKFHFLDAPVRGIWVRLHHVWSDACVNQDYPQPVLDMLGQMMAVTSMVANNVREEPSIILQAVGSGPLKLAFAECREHSLLRCIARVDEDNPEQIFAKHGIRQLLGEGQMALTMVLKNGSTYQGLVALDSDDLLVNLESYFRTSEQLATCLRVVCENDTVTGSLLQLLPSEKPDDEDVKNADLQRWKMISSCFNRIQNSPSEELDVQQYLRKLFPKESIYLDNPIDLAFSCTCSRTRSENALTTLSREEIEEMLATENLVTVSCDFCGRNYEFDRTDLERVELQDAVSLSQVN